MINLLKTMLLGDSMIIKCVFPDRLIQDPVIYQVGYEFDVTTNIRQAKVTSDMGWVILDILGEALEVQKSLEWLADKGIDIQIIKEEDII